MEGSLRLDAVTPKDDSSFGKDHDQRPRLGADDIISALSPHPRSEGHRPHCSETLALTTVSFLNFPLARGEQCARGPAMCRRWYRPDSGFEPKLRDADGDLSDLRVGVGPGISGVR